MCSHVKRHCIGLYSKENKKNTMVKITKLLPVTHAVAIETTGVMGPPSLFLKELGRRV